MVLLIIDSSPISLVRLSGRLLNSEKFLLKSKHFLAVIRIQYFPSQGMGFQMEFQCFALRCFTVLILSKWKEEHKYLFRIFSFLGSSQVYVLSVCMSFLGSWCGKNENKILENEN